MEKIDYEELLRKYIGVVIDRKSCDFIPEIDGFDRIPSPHFTLNEIKELRRIASLYYD